MTILYIYLLNEKYLKFEIKFVSNSTIINSIQLGFEVIYFFSWKCRDYLLLKIFI